jgi:hypothetical protein
MGSRADRGPLDSVIGRATRYLGGCQRRDGGWGYTSHNRQSFVEPTAWAVVALLGNGPVGGSAVEAAVEYLLAAQNSDGGWSNVPGLPSDMMTARAVFALAGVLDCGPAVARGAQWLRRHELASGGWGWCYGTTGFLETAAFGILALSMVAELPDKPRLITYVEGLACADGGWCSHTPTKVGHPQASQVSVTPLGITALRRLGVTVDEDGPLRRCLGRVRDWLAADEITTTYSVATTLWALAEADMPIPSTKLVDTAIALMTDDGSWRDSAWYTSMMCYALGRVCART